MFGPPLRNVKGGRGNEVFILALRVGPADVVILLFGALTVFPLGLPDLPLTMGTFRSSVLAPVPGAELEDALPTPFGRAVRRVWFGLLSFCLVGFVLAGCLC